MQYYLDTEFAENGSTIKLISIGLVCEDGREYYAVASDGWAVDDCSDWVKTNVLPNINTNMLSRIPRKKIAEDIIGFLSGMSKVEIWGYFADYDWVVFCQLFGRMIDLPKGFPMFCLDLKQEMHLAGVKREDLPESLRKSTIEHHALVDARWNRDLHVWLGK